MKIIYFLISAIIVFFDQATKYVIVKNVASHEIIEVLAFFRIVNVSNRGAAFGLLQWAGNSFFIIISLIAISIIAYMIIKDKEGPLGLSLILGGAIGNLIDRFRFGYVVDFLDFHIGRYHWPAFNIADSSLTVGIILLLITYLFLSPKKGMEQE